MITEIAVALAISCFNPDPEPYWSQTMRAEHPVCILKRPVYFSLDPEADKQLKEMCNIKQQIRNHYDGMQKNDE